MHFSQSYTDSVSFEMPSLQKSSGGQFADVERYRAEDVKRHKRLLPSACMMFGALACVGIAAFDDGSLLFMCVVTILFAGMWTLIIHMLERQICCLEEVLTEGISRQQENILEGPAEPV